MAILTGESRRRRRRVERCRAGAAVVERCVEPCVERCVERRRARGQGQWTDLTCASVVLQVASPDGIRVV